MISPHLAIFAILGLSTLWTLRLIYSDRAASYHNHLPILVVTIASWVLVLFGLASLGVPYVLVFLLVISAMIAYQYRNSERRQLLWTMAIAAQRGLPLSLAARAFSQGRIDEIGRRTYRLAELLESGTPLPLALKYSRNPLPADAQVAVEIGFALDSLELTLADAAKTGNRISRLRQTVFDKIAYFLLLAFVLMGVLLYLNFKVVPTYHQIMDDFSIELPAATQFTFSMFTFFHAATPVVAILAFVFGIAVLYGIMRYMGWPLPEPPLTGRLIGKAETPILFQALSYTIKSNRTIPDAIMVLEKTFPARAMRKRLGAAAKRIKDGADWCESLRAGRIISSTDFALLKSAQRVGNLQWALEELAEIKLRRIEYRTAAFSRVLSPILVLLFALIIGCMAVGLFSGLVRITETLA